jgi:hypothetical protein
MSVEVGPVIAIGLQLVPSRWPTTTPGSSARLRQLGG